ncbi:hypothetical protein TRAPUB_9830 [Trametes pubescens]|uniref:Uncharacterized protein n=1 Tax=Trametes pubescens TaxID=154538 RepID=A0A1M2W1B0_TRAPU|nr:hypothetical protein TRAPUB_9830 [Trametes pubescens]
MEEAGAHPEGVLEAVKWVPYAWDDGRWARAIISGCKRQIRAGALAGAGRAPNLRARRGFSRTSPWYASERERVAENGRKCEQESRGRPN